jgi:hypothetical protein
MLAVAEDEQLPVAAAREGDPGAWHVLFKRYQLPLYVYVFELVHHEQTALDIVQESFINATRYLRTLREDQQIRLRGCSALRTRNVSSIGASPGAKKRCRKPNHSNLPTRTTDANCSFAANRRRNSCGC